jgi:ABC-type Fe3+/spermidine/putrescine transport system ATPase subunit
MTAGAVALEGVTKRYAGQAVVDDVSIAIAPGEFFTLLGPSGSGKTTTLSMIAGFTVPDSGVVRLGGTDMTHAAPRDRALGMVFQNYAIFPHLNVFENVAFPLRARNAAGAVVNARVAEALAMVQLSGMEKRHARQLSGGQQQRVALARAIAAQPGIVLMDEPLGALDKNLRYHMQTEIKDIQRRLGMTVIFVTHDQEEAMNMSDRIAIMDGGRLVQVGPPREVYERPNSAFAGRFLGEANMIAGTADGAMLRTPAGIALTAANARKGPSLLFVRPEKLSLRLDFGSPAPGENSVGGHVCRSAFLGNVIRTELMLDSAEVLTIDAANGPGASLLAPGTPATAVWAAAESRLLEA